MFQARSHEVVILSIAYIDTFRAADVNSIFYFPTSSIDC